MHDAAEVPHSVPTRLSGLTDYVGGAVIIMAITFGPAVVWLIGL